MLFKFIGIIAAIITTGSFLPQAYKTIKTKDTMGISLIMYILFVIGLLLWLIYGIYLKDMAIILANAITLIFASVILSYKIINIKKGKEK